MANGATGISVQLVSLAARTPSEAAASIPSPPPPSPPVAAAPAPHAGCKRKFGKWCIDGSRLDRADIAGIIVGVSIAAMLLIAAVAVAGLLIVRFIDTWSMMPQRASGIGNVETTAPQPDPGAGVEHAATHQSLFGTSEKDAAAPHELQAVSGLRVDEAAPPQAVLGIGG